MRGAAVRLGNKPACGSAIMHTNAVQGENTDASATIFVMLHTGSNSNEHNRTFCYECVLVKKRHACWLPVKFFSKLNLFISGYFDPVNIFSDDKNDYFSG